MQIWPRSRNSGIWTSEALGPRARAPRRIRPRRLVLACTTPTAGPARLEETSKRHTLLLTGGRQGSSLLRIPSQSRYSEGRPVYNSHLLEKTNLADCTNLNSNSPPTHYALSHGTGRHTRHGYHTRNRLNVRCQYRAVTYILTHLSSTFILQTASPFLTLTKSETSTVLLVLRVSCASDSLTPVQVCYRVVNSCFSSHCARILAPNLLRGLPDRCYLPRFA